MAKAILIMDMPESCDMCDFVDDKQPPRYGEKNIVLWSTGNWRGRNRLYNMQTRILFPTRVAGEKRGTSG